MLITIISDASFNSETGGCGWSWWLASGRGKIGGQGHETTPVINSNVAETIAVFRGVLGGCMAGLIHPGDALLLQTDCQSTILAIEGKRTSIRPEEVEVVLNLLKLVTELRLTVTMRHVKGHTSGKTPRTWINNKCDELAGIERRKADKILKAVKHQPTTEDLGPPWD